MLVQFVERTVRFFTVQVIGFNIIFISLFHSLSPSNYGSIEIVRYSNSVLSHILRITWYM